MLLHDFLNQYVLIEDTHALFEYSMFALRLETRFGRRIIRGDYTPAEIQNVAQNTLDVNLLFLTGISRQVLSPFKTWGETGTTTLGTGFTDTTTPNLTDTTTPDLQDTTTPDLTDETKHTGTVGDKQRINGSQDDFVNAYNTQSTSNPRNNSKTESNSNGTTTFNNTDTTTHIGSTKTTHTGSTKVTRSGTNTVKHANEGTDEYDKSGWSIDDYNKALQAYVSFIDMVIDMIVPDILYITVRGGDKHGEKRY